LPLHGAVTRVSAERLLDKRNNQSDCATKIACRIPQSTGHDAIKIIPGRPAQVLSAFGRCTVALYALKLLLDRVNNTFRDH
jgi:HlyD family secretion protein